MALEKKKDFQCLVVSIVVAPKNNASAKSNTLTDSKGNFEIKNLPPGIYQLIAKKNCWYPYSTTLEVKEGNFNSLTELKLNPQCAEGELEIYTDSYDCYDEKINVYIDDLYAGILPFNKKLSVGEHSYYMRTDGHEFKTETETEIEITTHFISWNPKTIFIHEQKESEKVRSCIPND